MANQEMQEPDPVNSPKRSDFSDFRKKLHFSERKRVVSLLADPLDLGIL